MTCARWPAADDDVKLYIVRHAHAGSRSQWNGDDRLRPLSEKGIKQAGALAKTLVTAGVSRLLASPYIRCIETFHPAASEAATALGSDERLAEGAGYEGAWPLVADILANRDTAALCSHGDVIPAVLHGLAAEGVSFHHPLRWPKASTWVITATDSRWSDAHYLEPPRID